MNRKLIISYAGFQFFSKQWVRTARLIKIIEFGSTKVNFHRKATGSGSREPISSVPKTSRCPIVRQQN